MCTCTGCKEIRYCDAICQKCDWRTGHRTVCKIGSATRRTPLLAHACGACKLRELDDLSLGQQGLCYRCGLLTCGACHALIEARQIERCPGCRATLRSTDLKAFELLRALVKAGDRNKDCMALARATLGTWLLEGVGMTEPKIAAGVRTLRDAADAKCAQATFSLGVCYATGTGVMVDPAQAHAYYAVASKAGVLSALFNLGCMALDKGDDAEAAIKFEQASLCGDVGATIVLGEFYEEGRGVDVHYAKAAALYGACRESPIAAAHLGILLKTGRGVPSDSRLAVRLLTMASESDAKVLEAQRELGEIYLHGTPTVACDVKKAEELLAAAAAKGDAHAAYQAGCLLVRGQGDVLCDEPRAANYFRRAAKAGVNAAIFNLGFVPSTSVSEDLGDLHPTIGVCTPEAF